MSMKPKTLGTILPNAETFALNDAYADKQARLNLQYASQHPVLSKCRMTQERGELRWIVSPTVYAVVGNQKAKFFERRADGDYGIKYK